MRRNGGWETIWFPKKFNPLLVTDPHSNKLALDRKPFFADPCKGVVNWASNFR